MSSSRDQRKVRRKLRILHHIEKTGNFPETDPTPLDAVRVYGMSTVAPSVVPLSMASWALTASFSAYS